MLRTSTRRFTRRRLAGAAAVAVFAVAAAAVPLLNPPEAAAIAGLQYVPLNSSNDSNTFKEVFVPCPNNTRGLGGGAVTGIAGTKITGIVPSATGVRFTASELAGGTSAAWDLEGLATCAPASSLPGLRYEVQTGTDQGSTNDAVTPVEIAFCMTGQVIGMGGSVQASGAASTSPERLNLRHIVPEAEGQDKVLVGADSNGYAGTFTTSAIAVCVDEGVPGHQIVEGSFVEGTGQDLVNPTVGCPEGTQPHAAGFFLDYRREESVGPHAYATAVVPIRGGSIINPGIAVVALPNGTDLDWSASATGICAT